MKSLPSNVKKHEIEKEQLKIERERERIRLHGETVLILIHYHLKYVSLQPFDPKPTTSCSIWPRTGIDRRDTFGIDILERASKKLVVTSAQAMRAVDEIESDDDTPKNEVDYAVKVLNRMQLLLVAFRL